MRRGLIALAAIVVALSGCGGGDDRLSKDEWVRQADAICKRVNDRLEETEQPQTMKQLVTVLEQGLKDVRVAVGDLRELEPPADIESDAVAWLERVEAAADQVEAARDAAKKEDEAALSKALAAGTQVNDDSNARASELGLTECAEE